MPTQTGSIDFTSAGGLKSYAAGQFATQGTVTDMQTQISQNANDITLRATKTEAYQVAQPNLSPYYSSVPYASTNTYWKSIQLGNGFTFTSMGDGWMRVQCTNSGSSVIRRDWYPIKCPSVRAGQPYTWLAEVRNNASSSVSSNSDFYLVQTNNLQFWGQKAIKTIEGPSGSGMSVNIGTCGSTYTLRKVQNAETADGGHWTNNDEANVVGLACWTFRCAANSTIDYEVRLSVYEGEYTGPYKPYSGTQLYASQAELKVQADRIGMVVSNADASSSLQLTPAAITAVTDNLTIKDSSGSATVISGGKIQANSLTIGDMSADTQADILNSNVQVGGRNLLVNTGNYNTWDASSTSAPVTKADDYIKFTPQASSQWWTIEPHSAYIPIADWDASGTYTVSVDVKFDNLKSTIAYPSVALSAVTNNTTVGYAARVYERSFSIAPTTNDWTHFEYTVSGDYTTWNKPASGTPAYIKVYIWLYLNSSNADAVSFRKLKLEKGNKPSDWTPAPEDMATAESLAGTNESLDGAIEDIGELSDQLVDTTTEQNKTITTIQTYLNSLRKDLDAEIQSRQQWLNFNAAEGLVIGAAGSTFKTVTTNTSQQFRSGGMVLAETSGTEFVAPVMRSDQLLIGNWMWTRRDNGNLSLKWIG